MNFKEERLNLLYGKQNFRFLKITFAGSSIVFNCILICSFMEYLLDAPQYPEGLMLEIWPNKIAGDVDIINGLNHYIGMKTLKTSDFIEFTVLPYIIGFLHFYFYLLWP